MTAKDVAFVMLFVLFIASVLGNALLLPYYINSGQAEDNLKQQVSTLQAEKTSFYSEYQQEVSELADENEDLAEEIEDLEGIIKELQGELESQTGTTISYEDLVTTLRARIHDLEAETLELQGDLNECKSQGSHYSSYHHPCYWYDPCYYPCPSCHCYPSYYGCHQSVSVSNVSGIFQGQPYDAVIYVYFSYRPCYVLRIYVDILDLNTIQIVGVDWD